MRTRWKNLSWIVAALVVMGAYSANAQDSSRMTARDVFQKIRTMSVDQMNQIVWSMDRDQMVRIIQGMDGQTMSEIARSLDPRTVAEIAQRISVELAMGGRRSVATTSTASRSRPLRDNARNESAASQRAVSEGRKLVSDNQPQDGVLKEQMNLTEIAVITHPSNPLGEMTLEQIQKIYTGEYDNWRQVGGPDRQMKVIAVGDMPRVRPRLTSKASVCAFAGTVFMDVAMTSGAIGFVPQMRARQLRFIQGHDAVKTMAVRIDGLNRGGSKVIPDETYVHLDLAGIRDLVP
jgi:PBP superfamily domain